MRPQVRVADRCLAQLERQVAAAVAMKPQPGRCDPCEREVEGHGQHDAHPHHDTPVGDGVERAACREVREQHEQADREQRDRDQQRQSAERLAQTLAIGEGTRDLQSADHREIDRDLAHVEDPKGEHAGVRCALPQHPLAGGQRFGQAGDGLEVVFRPGAVSMSVHDQNSGSARSSSAYSSPAPQ